jgi:hypothetical protein
MVSQASRISSVDYEPRPGPAKTRSRKAARRPAFRPVPASLKIRVRFVATVVLGIVLPLLSLGLSDTGGEKLLSRQYGLASFSLLLMGSVLTVSLSHLAWAVRDITGSPVWASWLLAVAFDCCIILGELNHVANGWSVITAAMMVVVCGLSMFLNVWAFLQHKE